MIYSLQIYDTIFAKQFFFLNKRSLEKGNFVSPNLVALPIILGEPGAAVRSIIILACPAEIWNHKLVLKLVNNVLRGRKSFISLQWICVYVCKYLSWLILLKVLYHFSLFFTEFSSHFSIFFSFCFLIFFIFIGCRMVEKRFSSICGNSIKTHITFRSRGIWPKDPNPKSPKSKLGHLLNWAASVGSHLRRR